MIPMVLGTMCKLAIASIALLAITTYAQVKYLPEDYEVIFERSDTQQRVWRDLLQPNSMIVANCSESKLEPECNITGWPLEESSLKPCTVKFTPTYNLTTRLGFQVAFRMKEDKLLVLMFEWVRRLSSRFSISTQTFRILDGCKIVKTLAFYQDDVPSADMTKLAIYEDGFDVVRENITWDGNILYQNYNASGDLIGEHFAYLEEQKSSIRQSPSFGKSQSHGFFLESGYHLFPNGSIVSFGGKLYKEMRQRNYKESIISDADDGNYHTACVKNPNDTIYCVQYDVFNNRKLFDAEMNATRSAVFGNVRNLSGGGFLLSMFDNATMIAYRVRPDLTTVVDELRLQTMNSLSCQVTKMNCYVSQFDEETGRVTIVYDDDRRSVRSSFILPIHSV